MIQAFSRLPEILGRQNLTVPELHRRMKRRDWDVNIKTLYRLNDAHSPLTRLDLRVAGAICQLCDVNLADLVDFSHGDARLAQLSAEKQKRLDALMDKNNKGKLTANERAELSSLVRETQEITLRNARVLAGHQRRLKDR